MTANNINFNATVPGSTGSDGLPLLSTQHPIQTGVQANTFNQGVQFSEKALEDAKIIMDGCKNAKASEVVPSRIWKMSKLMSEPSSDEKF